MKVHLQFAVALVISVSVLASAQQQAEPAAAQIVDQLYPQKLADFMSKNNLGSKDECFQVYDRLSDGTPKTIMAGYANGFQSQIDVIQRQSSGNYEVVYQPSGLAMNSTGCSVELHDVDGDGVLEVWYGFGDLHGREGNWVFKWDGTQLINLTPTSQNSRIGTWTNISQGFLMDTYHDGTQEILSTEASPNTPDLPDRLYRLSNGQYVLDSTLVTAFPFTRSIGKPQPQLWPFSVGAKSTGPYLLKITNGDRGGANRVTSAHILVNGTQVFGPSDFNQQVEFLSVPLTNVQPGDNTLSVQLEGAPGSHLIVLIQDQTPALQSAQ